MEQIRVDYVVIGSGPAGQKAAIQAAKLGKSVAVIERDPHLGGASLNSGTIPSKSLREAILDLTDFYKRSFYADSCKSKKVSINDLNYRLNKVLDEQRANLKRQFDKNKILIIHGMAQFLDAKKIRVKDENSQMSHFIDFEYCLISTGSKPRNPIHVPFDNEKVLDSLNKAYELAEKAKKYGVSNLIQARIESHEKHGWMLRSIIKA